MNEHLPECPSKDTSLEPWEVGTAETMCDAWEFCDRLRTAEQRGIETGLQRAVEAIKPYIETGCDCDACVTGGECILIINHEQLKLF
jgi:hypothetical protein